MEFFATLDKIHAENYYEIVVSFFEFSGEVLNRQ